MSWEDQGQFTGEISPLMLKELGLDLVMIGHSERRHVFGETDVEENKKVKAALNHGFTTLLCIGETAEEKNSASAQKCSAHNLKSDSMMFRLNKQIIFGLLMNQYGPSA